MQMHHEITVQKKRFLFFFYELSNYINEKFNDLFPTLSWKWGQLANLKTFYYLKCTLWRF